jgi:small subunit ribosomal protein S7
MPRRGTVPLREIGADPMYNNETAARFINKLMVQGKKGLAQRIFYDAMDIVKKKTGKDPVEVFEQAVKNIMPVLEVKPRRVGGATYQVPVEVRPERRMSLAMRWLLSFSRGRAERSMQERLAAEVIEAAANTGGAVKKREETHRMAEANKAFAHYRW